MVSTPVAVLGKSTLVILIPVAGPWKPTLVVSIPGRVK